MSLMHDLLSTSKPEFQCIVIIEDGSGGDDDDRLFPLTENVPKCLLPICNRPILHYQLDQLVLSGAVEIFIIGLDVYKDLIDQCIKEYKLIDRDMVYSFSLFHSLYCFLTLSQF
jgi:choline kinase